MGRELINGYLKGTLTESLLESIISKSLVRSRYLSITTSPVNGQNPKKETREADTYKSKAAEQFKQ